jgi:hypothetical protein
MIATTTPSFDAKIMSNGIRVLCIHIVTVEVEKIIPLLGASVVRSISPRSCSAVVSANSNSNPFDPVRVTIST